MNPDNQTPPDNLTIANNNFEVLVNSKFKYFINKLDNGNYSVDYRYYDVTMDEPEEVQEHILTTPDHHIALGGLVDSITTWLDAYIHYAHDHPEDTDNVFTICMGFHGENSIGKDLNVYYDGAYDEEYFRTSIRNNITGFFLEEMYRLG